VQTVQGSSAPFWEVYQKEIMYAIGAVLAIGLIYFGYKKMIVEPKQTEAVAAMWRAEMMFERDSFKLALENPGLEADGFLAVIDKFGGTPAGNMAKYYAGVSYMRLNDFDNAIQYMEDFDAEGDLLPVMKYGVLGDCYAEKQDFAKALSMYEKAADAGDNEVLQSVYLKRFAMLSEKQGNKDAAIKAYERLRRDYPNQSSQDWREVEKYIYRAGGGQ
jgi:tetratricopeptide (TPR) repeat protein